MKHYWNRWWKTFLIFLMIRTIRSFSSMLSNRYEYIDSGNYLRLEQFGKYRVIRSCPSAKWSKSLKLLHQWNQVQLQYIGQSGTKGVWSKILPTDSQKNWDIDVPNIGKFHLMTSENGQVGIFPEQQSNWNWIRETLINYRHKNPSSLVRLLNGFAYTGGSTLASLSSNIGVNVVHLDAAKSFVKIAKGNVHASFGDQASVRFIVEDCLTFVEREIKRGNQYEALIFDPPAFGRAVNGKTWQMEKDLIPFVQKLPQLLSSNPSFVLLSCHDDAWPSTRLASLLKESIPMKGNVSYGELTLMPENKIGNSLPLGVYARWIPNFKRNDLTSSSLE